MVLKPELCQSKLNTFHSVQQLLFPLLNSWSDCFYFVTKSSGMTCNTPNLAFNPQCNSKEIKLRAALRANLHWGWLLRFFSSGSKWAKSIRNAVFFSNEKTQASLWGEEPGLHADWKAAYSQWDPQRKDGGPNSHKGLYWRPIRDIAMSGRKWVSWKGCIFKPTITSRSAFWGFCYLMTNVWSIWCWFWSLNTPQLRQLLEFCFGFVFSYFAEPIVTKTKAWEGYTRLPSHPLPSHRWRNQQAMTAFIFTPSLSDRPEGTMF